MLRGMGLSSRRLLNSGRIVGFRNSKTKSKTHFIRQKWRYIQNICDAQFYHQMTNMFQRESSYNEAVLPTIAKFFVYSTILEPILLRIRSLHECVHPNATRTITDCLKT
jgi:hypothetical protein